MSACLRLARGLGDRILETNTLIQIAQIAQVRGDAGLGLEPAQAALAIARSIRHPYGEGVALCCLGNVELARANLDAAEAAFKAAHATATQLGMPFVRAAPGQHAPRRPHA